MSGLICPKCGRSDEEIEFIDAFCSECYPIKITCPWNITIEQCKRCLRIKIRGSWKNYSDKDVIDRMLKECIGEYDKAKYDFVKKQMVFQINLQGQEVEISRTIDVIMKNTICPDCSRASGGYFEAIIQLRGDAKMIERAAKKILHEIDGKTFVTKTEEKDGGLDLYIGNSKIVVGIINEFGERVYITKKLVGQDQGKRLFRTTFLIRFVKKEKPGATEMKDEQEKES